MHQGKFGKPGKVYQTKATKTYVSAAKASTRRGNVKWSLVSTSEEEF
jgi:hypothetical protein